jgi:hypothetical protein
LLSKVLKVARVVIYIAIGWVSFGFCALMYDYYQESKRLEARFIPGARNKTFLDAVDSAKSVSPLADLHGCWVSAESDNRFLIYNIDLQAKRLKVELYRYPELYPFEYIASADMSLDGSVLYTSNAKGHVGLLNELGIVIETDIADVDEIKINNGEITTAFARLDCAAIK